eukprot:7967021-Karenia_brevis.AAC.1
MDKHAHLHEALAYLDTIAEDIVKLKDQYAIAESRDERRDCENIYEKYADMVIEGLQDHLRLALQRPCIDLTWTSYVKAYGGLHEKRIWREVCDNFCDSSYEPMTKSDAFIFLLSKLCEMWPE